MPSCARGWLIDESRVGTYQCSSHCVRHCSFRERSASGLDQDHRVEWLHKRVDDLASIFAVQVCDFAVLYDQFDLILRNRPDLAVQLTAEEVAQRWQRLSLASLDLKPAAGAKEIEKLVAKRIWIAERRQRLSSISWFMRMLKEPVARAANAEDGVRGHFFNERFESLDLEDAEPILDLGRCILAMEMRLGHTDGMEKRFMTLRGRMRKSGNRPLTFH